jgi:Zn-dependent protease
MMTLNSWLLDKILLLPAILIGLTVHEFAHAYMADKLGDKTPKFQGRLTLNPFVHLDPFGFLMIILVGFGWAKPVQTNPGAYRNFYKDDLKVSLAGPLSNLLVAFLGAVLIGILSRTGMLDMTGSSNMSSIIISMLSAVISINCMLFVFNLIPLPGLDGFHALRDISPDFFNRISDSIYRYQLIILMVFVATPLSTYIVGVPTRLLYYSFIRFINIIF